jgi:mRNA interferase MazF
MKIKQFEIWLADLDSRRGTAAGKVRPVLVVQTDLLNTEHSSTIICPITAAVQSESAILHVHLKKGVAKLKEDCDIMIDQLRAIDNKRLLKRTGRLSGIQEEKVRQNLRIIFDL